MADRYKLYSLNDETGIRYIGITKQKLSSRLSSRKEKQCITDIVGFILY